MRASTRAALFAAFTLSLVVFVGCGDSTSESGPTDGRGDVGSDVEAPGDVAVADTAGAIDVAEDIYDPFGQVAIVETAVTPGSVVAGEPVDIQCTAFNEKGVELVEFEFVIDIDPAGGGTLEGSTYTPSTAAQHQVTCRIADGGPADETPFHLLVRAGEPAVIVATVEPAEVTAGGSARVTCALEDDQGNVLAGQGWTVEAPEGVAVNGLDLTATSAGEHEIACHLVAGDEPEESRPATLIVVPGEPVEIALTATPSRRWYKFDSAVTLGYDVLDVHGNVVPDVDYGELSLTVEPVAGLEAEEGTRLRFVEKGIYVVTGQVAGPPAAEASIELVCDPDAPLLTITHPERGRTQNSPAGVTVTGVVEDEVSGVTRLTINDIEVPVQPDGAFSLPIDFGQGMNVLTVIAEDAVGHVTERIQSVYFSPVWYGFDPLAIAESYVDEAVSAFIGREFFYAEEDPDKLTASSLIGDVLANLDFAPFIPSPATDFELWPCSDTTYVYIDDIQYTVAEQVTLGPEGNERTVGNPMLTPIDGGLHLFARLTDFSAHMVLDTPDGGWTCMNEDGHIFANVDITADVFIGLDEQGELSIRIDNLNVDVRDLTADTSGLLDVLLNLSSNFLDDIIEGIVRNMVDEEVAGMLAELTEGLELAFDFDLDPFIGEGDPINLQLLADIQRLEFRGAQPGAGAHLALAATVLGPEIVEHPSLGAIGRASCLGQPEVFELAQVHDLEMALFDDILNQATYALWRGGMLHLHLTEEALGDTDISQYGIADLVLDTAPLLPPIVTSCNAEGQLVAQVGDFWAHATFGMFGTPTDIELYLFAEIALNPVSLMGEEGPEVGIEIADISLLTVDIVALNEEQRGNRDTLRALLEQTLPTVLMNEVASEPITFEIPEIDLSGMDEEGQFLPRDLWIAILVDELGRSMGRTTAAAHIVDIPPPVEPEPTPAP